MLLLQRLRTFALCAAALTAPASAAAQDQRAVLELLVNAVPRGEALVVLRGDDVLVGVQRLAEAGLQGLAGVREAIDDETMVSLASLAGSLSFSVDERDLRLNITATSGHLGHTVRKFGGGAPPDMLYRSDPSAFLNYGVAWTEEDGTSLFGETGANVGQALFHGTFSATGGALRRGISSATFDDRKRMRRWAIGDAFAQSGPLGGDAWTGGVTLTREFGIEPYFVRYPSLSLSTPVTIPSVVEVHVNGRVVSREQVEPGRLDVQDLPLTVGRNDAHLVVRDAFGGSQEVSASYYLAGSVLAAGLHDYQYSLGFRRADLGTSSWSYKEPVVLARHRVGLTKSLTAGGRIEASRDVVSAGPTINVRLPVGEFEAAAGLSEGREGRGGAALAGFTYSGQPISAGVSAMAASGGYTTVNARPRAQRPSTEARLFASMGLGHGASLTGQYSVAALHGGLSRSRSAMLATMHLGGGVQLTASAARIRDERGVSHEAFVGISMQIGRASTSASVASTRTTTSVAVEAQQPLPVGIGYGYQARAETGIPGSTTGALQYQGKYGRYEARHDVIGGTRRASMAAAGALVAIGGRVFASRPVHQSFALLRVPGVEGVRGFASNQEVGRTDRSGDLLVPDLQPYYGNLLNISDSDVPLDYSIESIRLTLALPYRGGALAVFPVSLVRRVMGTVRIGVESALRVPEYGELRITPAGAEETAVSPLGATGEFYFENLRAGRHPAEVRDAAGSCSFTIEIPDTKETLVDVGEIRCVPPEDRQ